MRLLVEDDLPWLHYLFGKRYPRRYDQDTTERWFKQAVITNPLNFYAARTDDAFLVALVAVLPWIPSEPEVNVVGVCAEEDSAWQVVRLLRASIDWSIKRNAARWRISTDTGYDLSSMALRVGARQIRPRYEIDLRKPL